MNISLIFIIFGFGFGAYWIIKLKKQAIESSRATKDVKLLQELSVEMSSYLELDNLLPAIMNAFVKAGGVNKGSLMFLDEELQELVIKASIGLSKRAIKGVRPKIGEGIAGRVFSTGKSILIDDTSKDKWYKDFTREEKDERERPMETLLSLPLIFKGKVLGVATLNSKITGEPFIRNDEILMTTLTNQAAVAINNAKMYEMAITDGLTKLYLQKYFYKRLNEEIERAIRYKTQLSLLMMDLDHFKNFNDAYGHQIGDLALVHLAEIMRASTRKADISSRYGGEEFVMILPETDIEQAGKMAERMRNQLESTPIRRAERDYHITVSIGVAIHKDGVTGEKIVGEADKALYRAKAEGRNRVCLAKNAESARLP